MKELLGAFLNGIRWGSLVGVNIGCLFFVKAKDPEEVVRRGGLAVSAIRIILLGVDSDNESDGTYLAEAWKHDRR